MSITPDDIFRMKTIEEELQDLKSRYNEAIDVFSNDLRLHFPLLTVSDPMLTLLVEKAEIIRELLKPFDASEGQPRIAPRRTTYNGTVAIREIATIAKLMDLPLTPVTMTNNDLSIDRYDNEDGCDVVLISGTLRCLVKRDVR